MRVHSVIEAMRKLFSDMHLHDAARVPRVTHLGDSEGRFFFICYELQLRANVFKSPITLRLELTARVSLPASQVHSRRGGVITMFSIGNACY